MSNPNQSFQRYWPIAERILILLAAVIAIGHELFGDVQKQQHLPPNPIVISIQFLVILVFVAVILTTPLPAISKKREFERAVAATRQFYRFWLIVWISWLGMYGIFLLQALKIFPGPSLTVELLTELFGLLASSQLFLCYLVMVKETVPPTAGWYRQITLIVLACFILVGAKALLMAFGQGLPIHIYSQAIEGLLSGVGLALFVGRLESMLIGSSRFVVVALYGYAVIQFSNLESNDDSGMFIALTTLALFMKVILFFEVNRVIRRRILAYYMLEYRAAYERDRRHRKDVLLSLADDPDRSSWPWRWWRRLTGRRNRN